MRFNVGEKPFFVRVDYTPGEKSFFRTLYMPWNGDKINSIQIIQLEVMEHHKVPWDQDPAGELKYDGFVMKEVTKEGHGDTFHNQYPDACYGQLDDTNDRVVFRQPHREDEFWGARFTLLSSYLTNLVREERRTKDGLEQDMRLMLAAHREEIEKVLKDKFGVEVNYTNHVMRFLDPNKEPVTLENVWDANFT